MLPIHAIEKTATCLQELLVSTGLPPHFSMAIDKSTPHRDTNQAIILIIPCNGKRVAVPVDAPIVYHVSPDQGRWNWGGGQPPPLPFSRRGKGGQRCLFNLKNCLGEIENCQKC